MSLHSLIDIRRILVLRSCSQGGEANTGAALILDDEQC